MWQIQIMKLSIIPLSLELNELTFPEKVKNKKSFPTRQKALIKDWILNSQSEYLEGKNMNFMCFYFFYMRKVD